MSYMIIGKNIENVGEKTQSIKNERQRIPWSIVPLW